MKLSPEQLISWTLTVAYTGPKDYFPGCEPSMRAAAEEQMLQMLAGRKGKERAEFASGMKQGINDMLRMVEVWTDEERRRVDDALAAKGLPSLRTMELKRDSTYKRMLARRRIETDEEYYIAAEVLRDQTIDVSDEERAELEGMTIDYGVEKRKKV